MVQKQPIVIEYKGRLHVFELPCNNIANHQFFDKCWFRVKNASQPDIDTYAEMYVAWKYNGCEYEPQHMITLKRLVQDSKMTPIIIA